MKNEKKLKLKRYLWLKKKKNQFIFLKNRTKITAIRSCLKMVTAISKL